MRKNRIKDIKENIPVANYNKKLECMQMQDGSYMDIYLIVPKDLVNGDPDDIEMDCFTWAKFYKTYGLDVEIISMKFPCDTSKQQDYWKKLHERNENPLFDQMIQRKLSELKYRERHTVKKEFYLQFFYSTEEEISSSRKTIESTMGIRFLGSESGGPAGGTELLEELPEEKKRQILFKIANKNSQIF